LTRKKICKNHGYGLEIGVGLTKVSAIRNFIEREKGKLKTGVKLGAAGGVVGKRGRAPSRKAKGYREGRLSKKGEGRLSRDHLYVALSRKEGLGI